MTAAETLGARLRRLRVERGCSLSELSRRSGVGKGTISELENDRRGARLDTLFALTTALGAPLGALMPDGAVPAAAQVEGDAVTATLLARWPVERYLIEVYRATLAERRQESAAHAPGVLETVTVVRGRVLAGCAATSASSPRVRACATAATCRTGSRLSAPRPTLFLLMHYPGQESTEGTITDDR